MFESKYYDVTEVRPSKEHNNGDRHKGSRTKRLSMLHTLSNSLFATPKNISLVHLETSIKLFASFMHSK